VTRRGPFGLAVAFAWALLALPAHAELKNCSKLIDSPGDYKVVLDDLAFASTAAQNNPDLAALRGRVQFNFTGQLERIRASARELNSSLEVPMQLIVCEGRKPSLNGSEFTPQLAEALSNERVVVEMWGILDLRTTAAGGAAPRVMIGYVIPPVQHYVTATEAPPIHVLQYPKTGAAQSPDELENLPELYAFALVGLGTKAAKANRYDLAVWAFNRAEAGILDARVAGPSDSLGTLLAYVKRAACLTRASAQKDHNYSGPLTLVPVKSCGAAP
jgi:hypothetical protein